MKKRFLSIVLTFCMLLSFMPLIPVTAAGGDVEINEDNFPNEKFRNYVISFDTDNNNILDSTEISNVKTIRVINQNITDLTGVGFFTNVTELDCYGNQLTSLDLSKNTALNRLYCHKNQLTSLDLSQNTELKELWCGENQLTLDLSKNTALTRLSCYGNKLTSLDLSNNTALTSLDCGENQLTSLDLSQNTALTRLSCYDNQLNSLDLSNNTALTSLRCYNNQLTSLDLSQNKALSELNCSSNQLISLDLSQNTALTTLWCISNQLTSLDLSQNKALTTPICNNNSYKIDLVGDTFDLSELPTGFNIKNASKWQNATVNVNTLTVVDPTTKNVTYTYDLGNNKKTTFRLFWDSFTITANMIDPIDDQIYTNTDIEPEITITCGSYTLISGTDYTVSYKDNKNVGTATATVTGKGDFYKGSVSVTFKIVKATAATLPSPVAQNSIPYGATLSTVGLPDGWTWADGNTVPTVTNSGYVAYFTPADTDNYDWTAVEGWNASENRVERTVAVTVNKAKPNAPMGILGTAETIDGKADGKITGVTSAMEYRKDGTTDYTAIAGTEITGLADGKYYVRYKADANHNASVDTEVTIAKGRKLTVTVPTTQVGYTLTVNKTELVWNDSVTLTFKLKEGYSTLDTFAVKVNGTSVTLDGNGQYAVTNAEEDITITVEGVADITAPEISGIEDGKTYCLDQTVTVTEENIATVTLNRADITKMLDEDNKFTLSSAPGKQTIVVTDKAGNSVSVTVTVNNGHTGGTATCTNKAECSVCGKSYGELDRSNHTGGTATCMDKAVCDYCHKPYGELDSSTHAGGTEVRNAKEATCTEDGYTGDTYCKGCGIKLQDGKPITKLGHTDADKDHICDVETCKATISTCSGGTATCKDKAVCDYCHKPYGELDSSTHAGGTEVQNAKDATCTEDGYTGDTYCKGCGIKLQDGKPITKLGHIDADKNHVCDRENCKATISTCSGGTATCKDKAVCDYCNKPYGDFDSSIHAGGTHIENDKAATCNEDGYTGDTYCKGCGTKLQDGKPITKLGHIDADKNHVCDRENCKATLSTCSGGTATCKDKAVCDYCGRPYGELNVDNHALENVPATAATVISTGNIEFWHCTDCDKCFSDNDGKQSIELNDTVIPKLPPEIIDGNGQSLTVGEKKELTFRSNAAFSDFIRVEVDGNTVDENNYTVNEGSIVVTLKADYVATLSVGEHTLGVVSESGTATTTFTVKAKVINNNSPKTGDNNHMGLWFAMLIISGGLLITTGIYSKKKKYSAK